MGRTVAAVLAGLVSAPLTGVLSLLWMKAAPASIDLTGNYYLMVAFPAALVLHFAVALLLWKLFEPRPKVWGSIYVACHVAAQGAMQLVPGAPLSDVAYYCLAVLVSGVLVFTVFHRYFWCPQCAAPV